MNNYGSLLNATTPASVKNAGKKYLSGANLIRCVLIPEI
jgi:hypothetical protein